MSTMHIETININISSGTTAMTSALLKAIMAGQVPDQEATTESARYPAERSPRIGQAWPAQGGVYLGIMRGSEGLPDYHLILSGPEGEFKALAWGGYGKDAAGAKSDSDGQANTRNLQNSDEAHPAADCCADVEINGFGDWYLPARNELRLAYIAAKSHFDSDGWYWSSTQYSDNHAWGQLFLGGSQGGNVKKAEGRVRLVRRFVI